MANLRGRAGFPACSFATRQGCPFDETGTMPVLRSHAAKRVEDWGAYASACGSLRPRDDELLW